MTKKKHRTAVPLTWDYTQLAAHYDKRADYADRCLRALRSHGTLRRQAGDEAVFQAIVDEIQDFLRGQPEGPNRGFEVPCEESYAAIEAPNGELGFYIAGDGNETAYRARCRPPSVLHFAIFPHLIRGHTLSDVVAVLGSLNIIAAELDR